MGVRTRQSRASGWFLLLAAVIAGLLALAGCGTVPHPGGRGGTATPRSSVVLAFAVRSRPGAVPRRATLRCDPPGGTVRDPVSACARLTKLRRPFAPRPPHTICPMIMMGTGQITVTGTWFGQPVRRVVVEGGCDIALYAVLTGILR